MTNFARCCISVVIICLFYHLHAVNAVGECPNNCGSVGRRLFRKLLSEFSYVRSAISYRTRVQGKGRGLVGGSTSTCAAGKYCDCGSCKNCPAGKFSPSPGYYACTSCYPNTYSSGSGQTACTSCSEGQYTSYYGQTACTSCSTECNAAHCSSCSTSFTCFAGQKKITSSTECTYCEPGKYMDQNSHTSTTCKECAQGKFSPEEGSQSCTPCPSGKYANGTVRTSQNSACVNCALGKYNADTAASSCIDCPKGKYASGGTDLTSESSACKSCGWGEYSDATGVTDNQCQNCAAGKYDDGDQDDCKLCAEGRWSSNDGQFHIQYNNQQYQSSEFYCNYECESGKSNTYRTGCVNCEPGEYHNGAACAECKSCVEGQKSTCQGSDAGKCETCESGYYQDEAGHFLECKQCADGEKPTSNASSCESCPSGKAGKGGECISCTVNQEQAFADRTACVYMDDFYRDEVSPLEGGDKFSFNFSLKPSETPSLLDTCISDKNLFHIEVCKSENNHECYTVNHDEITVVGEGPPVLLKIKIPSSGKHCLRHQQDKETYYVNKVTLKEKEGGCITYKMWYDV